MSSDKKVEVAAAAEPAADAGKTEQDKKEPELKKVERPSQEKFDEALKAHDEKMAALDTKMRAISQTVSKKNADMSHMRRAADRAKSDLVRLRKRPAKLRAEAAALEKKLVIAEKQLNVKKAANARVQNELSSMINTRNTQNIGKAIDNKIRALDYMQKTESMSLTEEKNLIKEMGALRAMKRRAGELKMLSTRSEDQKVRAIREDIRRKKAQAASCETNFDKNQEEAKKLAEALTSKRGKDLPALEKKYQVLRKQKADMRKERKEIQDQYYNQKREFDKFSRELRNRRFKQEKEARDAWRKEQDELRKQWEEEKAKEKPWLAEIADCDTILTYLRSSLPKKVEEKVVAEDTTTVTLGDGTVVEVMGKSGKGGAAYINRKRSKKKKRRNRNRNHDDMPLHHSFKVIQMFSKLKIAMPHYVADLGESIETVKKARAMWDTKPRAAKKEKATKNEKAAKKSAKEAVKPPAAPASEAKPVVVTEDAAADVVATEEAAADEKAVDIEKIKARTRQLSVDASATEAKTVEKDEETEVNTDYVCYDDDEALGKKAPSLASLELCQGAAVAYCEKPTVVLFWAKFLKWQVYPAMTALEALHKGGSAKVIGIATDPKKSAVERHISKGECPTTFGLAFDTLATGTPGGAVKNAFKAVCGGSMLVPQVFLVNKEGTIVWRQPFSSGNPYETSNFEKQVEALAAGKPLAMNGAMPEDEESSDDDDDGEEVVELKDPMAADVAW